MSGTRTFYLAHCRACSPTAPMPFAEWDSRAGWVQRHRERTGHTRFVLTEETQRVGPDWHALGMKWIEDEGRWWISAQGVWLTALHFTGNLPVHWGVWIESTPTAPDGWRALGSTNRIAVDDPDEQMTEAEAWETCAALLLFAAGILEAS